MKKYLQKFITLSLTLFFILLNGINVFGVLGYHSSTSPLSLQNKVSAEGVEQTQESEETVIKDTLFFVDLDFVSTYGDYVYVYDKSDSTIKIVDKNTNTFREEKDNYRAYNLKDILVYNNVLMLYNGESLDCVDVTTFEKVEFDQTLLTTLSQAKTLKLATLQEEDYLIICPENPIVGNFEVAKLSYDQGVISVSEVTTFKVGEQFQGSLSSYNHIYVSEYEGTLFIMLVTDVNILSFKYTPSSPSEVYTVTAVTGVESNQEIMDVSQITLYDNTEVVAITLPDVIKFYNLEIDASSATLTQTDKQINISSDFIVSDVMGNASTIALISNESQTLKIYRFDMSETELYVEQEVENGVISYNLFTYDNYVYLDVVKSSSILETPYSKESLITAEENDNVVIVGEGVDELGKPISGWYYVMYSKNNENYYGYISSIDTNKLPQTEYEKTYVTVFAFTKLYSLPSIITDDVNSEVKTISVSSRLEVLDTACDYSSLGTKYLLVKVNGETVGFIDREKIIDVESLNGRIIPNATVLRDNSEIFTTTSADRETILTLDKGARVKVIGKRDTITNFTKVTFNDEDGNEYTGYIYTYNLEADTWSMLQIIGMFLVALNVILLIVIICIKNKVTR